MFIMPYDIESQFRNADFLSIAAERQSTTLSAAGGIIKLIARKGDTTTLGLKGRQT